MSRRSGWTAGKIVALILAAIVGACIVLGIVFRKELAVIWGDFTRYIERVEEEVPDEEGEKDNATDDAGDNTATAEKYDNMSVSGVENNGITLAMVPMLASDLSAQAESGLTITATVLPSQATDKTLDWSVEPVDASSEWVQGKTVTDYVTVTGTETGATVECLNPFGAQLLVKATSRSNPEVYATCTLDYYARVIGAKLNFDYLAPFTNKDVSMAMTKTVNVIPSFENMANMAITEDMCFSAISIDFEISDYTIPLSEEASVTKEYKITPGFYDHIEDSFPADIPLAVGGPAYIPLYRSDLTEINLKYFGLKWQWDVNFAWVVTLKPTYALEGGWEERIKDKGAAYLALANSYTEPAVLFHASYKDNMNDVDFYISLSYQKDYFAIDVENLEFDQTGAVM